MSNLSRCRVAVVAFSAALFTCASAFASDSSGGRHSGWHADGQSHEMREDSRNNMPQGNSSNQDHWNGTGQFQGHNISGLNESDRERWVSGYWRHGWHNNHIGWWWFAGGFWYFYPEPIYPYPDYISSESADDDYDYDNDDEAQPAYWYYCAKAKAFYPYVRTCNGHWERVPMTPPDLQRQPDPNAGGNPPGDGGYGSLKPPQGQDMPLPPPGN